MAELTHRGVKGLFRALRQKRGASSNDVQGSGENSPPLPQPDGRATGIVDRASTSAETKEQTGVSLAGEPTTQRTLTLVPKYQATKEISFRLWNKAYDNLKGAEPDLVETFEKVLSRQLSEESITWVTRASANMFVNCDAQMRFAQMNSIVLKTIEKSTQHGSVKEGTVQAVTVLTKLGSAVVPLLTPYPAAAMALSGVCTAISVCHCSA
jgi:hypothetical protein